MRGIMILSFHKKPGAFVDREYPKGITKQLGIDDIEQNKIYSLHRMRNTRPNYLFIKTKNVQVASFYSGFDLRQYVGRPNQCVSLILDNNENPTIWEDYLRRLAYELLPVLAEIRGEEIPMSGLSDDPKYEPFDRLLAQKFHELQEGKIEPMLPGEGEVKVGDGAVIEKVEGLKPREKGGIKNVAKNPTLTKEDIEAAAAAALASMSEETAPPPPASDDLDFATKQMEELEKETLRNEIRRLHELIEEKDNRVRALEAQLREKGASVENEAIAKIKGEYEALLASKEQELDMWRAKVAELNENNFINQDTIRKLTEMTMMQTQEMQLQAQTISKLRKQIKKLEAQQGAPGELSENDVQALRSHLTEVEETLRVTMEELDKKKEQNKMLFLKNKKADEEIDRLKTQIEELSSLVENLKKENEELKEKAKETDGKEELEKLLKEKDEKIKDLEKQLEETSQQLNLAKEQLIQAQDLISNLSSGKEDSVDSFEARELVYKQKIEELEKKIQELESSSHPSEGEGGGENVRLLEEKVSSLTEQLESMKKELITAKKTIKVQRREIENLQKLLGL